MQEEFAERHDLDYNSQISVRNFLASEVEKAGHVAVVDNPEEAIAFVQASA